MLTTCACGDKPARLATIDTLAPDRGLEKIK